MVKCKCEKHCRSDQDCNCDIKNLPDIDKCLPVKDDDDLFEIIPRSINYGNGYLSSEISGIQTSDINTIGNYGELYDIRGISECLEVTPWVNSSIEPTNYENYYISSKISGIKTSAIDTISNLKNIKSYNIRGTPACPKYVVEPWMNSSIEPNRMLI